MPDTNHDGQRHIPVLLNEVLNALNPQVGDSYLDLTAGYGGHAAAVLMRTHAPQKAMLIDRDGAAVAELQERFGGQGTSIRRQDFLTASQELAAAGRTFDLLLADLGVSSVHLDEASRGFAFTRDGPLDMRMDDSQKLTAAEIANTYSEAGLVGILTQYGEEPKARQIARLIIGNRPLVTTRQLASVVARAYPGHHRIHPATRTFQALRIAVNDELELLKASLPMWIHQLLAPGGRLVIISFHSLEDRVVKEALADLAGDRYDAQLRLLTKRPIVASAQELAFNPRARSAKLRAAAKINNNRKGSA